MVLGEIGIEPHNVTKVAVTAIIVQTEARDIVGECKGEQRIIRFKRRALIFNERHRTNHAKTYNTHKR